MSIMPVTRRNAMLLASLICSACGGAPYKPMVFHSGERQPMLISSGTVQEVRDVDIPIGSWKTGRYSGHTYGSAAGEAAMMFGGSMSLILVGSVVGGFVGILSDSRQQKLSGQELLFVPDAQGDSRRLVQPDGGQKLRAGEKVRIVEGAFVSRLERIQ